MKNTSIITAVANINAGFSSTQNVNSAFNRFHKYLAENLKPAMIGVGKSSDEAARVCKNYIKAFDMLGEALLTNDERVAERYMSAIKQIINLLNSYNNMELVYKLIIFNEFENLAEVIDKNSNTSVGSLLVETFNSLI